jgi:predicted nucleotidyltransferase
MSILKQANSETMKRLAFLTIKEKQALNELIGKLQSQFENQLRDIKLFGSKARGDFDEASDIDIFIVFDCNVDWKFKDQIYAIIFDIDLKYDVLISARIYSAQKLAEKRMQALPFIKNVHKQGVSLL